MIEQKAKRIEKFPLEEFIDNINISDYVLYQLDDIGQKFNDYIEKLCKRCSFDDYTIFYYWLDQNYKELSSSSDIEHHKFYFDNTTLIDSNLKFGTTHMSQNQIKNIHSYVCSHSNTHNITVGEYRKDIAWVGTKDELGDHIFWYGAEAKDIPNFMREFVEYYNKNNLINKYSNPFLKAALVHLLFVKIHPFADGNGRTARLLHNLSFTSNINRVYDAKLKLSPLNISASIKRNQLTYAEKINNIAFDLKTDNNAAINSWFRYILNMYDEQLFYLTERFPNLDSTIEFMSRNKDKEQMSDIVEKSKIKKFYK